MNFIVRLLVTALVAFGLARILPGIHVDTYWTALVFALVLALINAFVRPILVILTIPITILTFGLFLLVINALIVMLVSKFVNGFRVDGFWWALLFGLLLSIMVSLLFSRDDKTNG
jgi:putative membrane protein